jgi:hypothetical protein
VQRRTLQRVERTVVGVAVFLEPSFQENHERRFAARRWAEQQQQPASNVGTCCRSLEVIDDPIEGAVDPEQLA